MSHRSAAAARKAKLSAGSCALLCLATAPAAWAHDIWITADKAGGQLKAQVNFGDTDARQAPDRSRIVALDLSGGSGMQDLRLSLTPAQLLDHPVLETKPFAAASGSVIAVTYDNGFWLTVPNDKKETNTSKLLAPKGTAAHWTVKYGKILLGAGSFSRVLHTRIELVPLKDPYTLAAGQKLPVRLELEGKPLPNTKLGYGDGIEPLGDAKTPKVTTGADGIAEIPFTRKGAYVITADPTVPTAYPALAENDHLYVSLAFDTSK
jgi:uncharacterized GH25 family protein